MKIRRVVPNIRSTRPAESRDFYVNLLGFEVVMDMGWIVTFASPDNPTAQVSVVRHDEASHVFPDLTVEVGDVDAVHATAVARRAQIVYALTDEPWGVRRFCVADPNGRIVNVMSHRPAGVETGQGDGACSR